MLRVGVNGYGTVGKRIADAVSAQPDMELVGVAKTRPNYEARSAVDQGLSLYAAAPGRAGRFDDAGIPLDGSVDDLIDASDVVVDATPAGVGAENRDRYADRDTPAVFQGGESPDVADVSFNARANYDAAVGRDAVRVVSCNTTGLCRLIAPLREAYDVEKVRATLVRRGGDPDQPTRGPINDILPDPVVLPSHHGPDVETVLPGVEITTAGITVPATLMHLHAVTIAFDDAPTPDAVRDRLASERRIAVLPAGLAIDGCGALKEFARDAARPRGDLPENGVWGASIATDGDDVALFQAIHQESIVVPENVDAIRAIADAADAETSRHRTDETLGIGRLGDSLATDSGGDRERYARDAVRARYGNSF